MSEQKKDAVESESQKKYPLITIRGLPFPTHLNLYPPSILFSRIEDTIDFKPRDTDIFVVTYPKCGTTWTQFIVWEILHKGAVPPSPNQMIFRDCPFLEYTGVENLDDMPPPRSMKTHFPFNLQPYNPNAKYIYVVRNPWDCCVSYYYHHNNESSIPQLTFDEFFELFITGEVGWGDFFDHVLSWFEHRNDPNILFLTYENIKKDKKKTILGIAKFLGDSYYEDVKKDDVMENCLKHTDFQYMKGLGMFYPEGKVTELDFSKIKEITIKLGEIDGRKGNHKGFKEVDFFRKGEVGDWKNHFSETHIKKSNEYMLGKLKNTEMEDFWKPLLEETTL